MYDDFTCFSVLQIMYENYSLRKKCPYSELLWSTFFRIWTEYGEIRSISPYSVQIRENADQNNSEYGHFPRDYHDDSLNVTFPRFANCFLTFPLVFPHVFFSVSTVSSGVFSVSPHCFPCFLF